MLTYVEFENGSAFNLLLTAGDLYIYTARLDNSLQLWEVDTHKEVRNFIGHTDIISSIQLTGDEKTLLSSSWDGSVRLWDVGTGLMLREIQGTSGRSTQCGFSPDSRYVYSRRSRSRYSRVGHRYFRYG